MGGFFVGEIGSDKGVNEEQRFVGDVFGGWCICGGFRAVVSGS
jgi:hypothetical protein